MAACALAAHQQWEHDNERRSSKRLPGRTFMSLSTEAEIQSSEFRTNAGFQIALFRTNARFQIAIFSTNAEFERSPLASANTSNALPFKSAIRTDALLSKGVDHHTQSSSERLSGDDPAYALKIGRLLEYGDEV